MCLTQIGIAAARETLVTAAPHMAAIWTDLFESMLIPGCDLRWAGKGPGIGRDARIAYSSLLGRYTARAYLTDHEGVRVLVPLDVAKYRFRRTPFLIEKDPPGRGLEADWIGLDGDGLVSVEAKGTYDPRKRSWEGPDSLPTCLKTAIRQTGRTAVFSQRRGVRRKLPVKRWAIASRWGTEAEPELCPTLVAWDPGENHLDNEGYRELEDLLIRADADGVLEGLGHKWTEGSGSRLSQSRAAQIHRGLRVGSVRIEPGFGAILGPFGTRPLRDQEDLILLRKILEHEIGVAVVSLSQRYLSTLIEHGEGGEV